MVQQLAGSLYMFIEYGTTEYLRLEKANWEINQYDDLASIYQDITKRKSESKNKKR